MTDQSNSYDPLMTMAALNMAVVSLHRITSSGDRLILDREYTNIINNIRMGEINADPALTGLYQEIVRVIHGGRLRDDARAEIENEYSGRKRKSIREIISGNVLKSFSTNPLKWLAKLAMSSASEYFASQNQSSNDEKFRLKREELSEYDGLQRRLLDSSWKLLRQYGLQDDYRITQDGLVKFSAAMKESDPLKRHRMLKYLEREFSVYAPYWFYRAESLRLSGDNGGAEKYFAKFYEVWRPVLRKDPYMAEYMKFKIEGLMQGGINPNNAGEILKCLEVMRANSPIDEWANNIYMGMVYFALGCKNEAIDCVMCNIDFEYEIQNSNRLLALFEGKPLPEEAQVLDDKVRKPTIWSTVWGLLKSKSDSKEVDTTAEKAPIQPDSYTAPQCKPELIPAVQEQVIMPLLPQPENQVKTEIFDSRPNALVIGQIKPEVQRQPDSKPENPEKENTLTELDKIRKAAEKGDAESQFQLGLMYYVGSEVEQDYYEAFKWYHKAAEQGHASAQNRLGFLYSIGWGVSQDKAEAAKWWSKAAEQYRKAAEKGDAEAQFQLGAAYRTGWGVTKDISEAVKWHRKAVEQGHVTAQIKLGDMYANGEGVDQDYQEAFCLYHKAAEQGDAWAQNKVGDMYANGEGVNQDYQEAFVWYSKAAEQGDADAQNNLGVMYSRGNTVEQDKSKALSWFLKAAEQGHVLAQLNLGIMYSSNRDSGIPQDYSEALIWFRMAAENGDSYAQYRLGNMYYKGLGVAQNKSEAVKWFREAARQGDPDAQSELKWLGETW